MPDEIAIDQLLDAALARHQAGQLDLAEAGYRAVLQRDPGEPDALNLLSVILQARGDLDGSIALASRALDIVPDFPEALINLARAHRAAGAPGPAADAARRAVALDADQAEAYLQLGCALLDLHDDTGASEALTAALTLDPDRVDVQRMLARALASPARAGCEAGDSKSAIVRFRRVTELAPDWPEAWVALGQALSHQNAYDAAAEAFRAALALQADDPGVLIELAAMLGESEHFEAALASFRKAEVLAPSHPRVLHGIAACLIRLGDDAAAAEMCRRALETTPDWPVMWRLLGSCEARLGHFDQSIGAYRRCLALEPQSADALHDLVIIEGQLVDQDATKIAAEALLNEQSQPTPDRAAGGFALAHVYDRQGAYDEAFVACASANQLLRDDFAARGIIFDRQSEAQRVDWLIETIGRQAFAATSGWGDPSDRPVFVVGMPRSGTSLVEQIAASHRQVFGAGERKDIADILVGLGREPATGRAVAWDRSSVSRAAAAHVRHLQDLGGDAVRVIDKMPNNVMVLGQIAMLFPQARIVVCQRDPRDTSLSCFFQCFRDDAVVWAHDLADCGFMARQIDRVMNHWRNVLPIPILEIQYETLVSNLEGESRRLIDFLGLGSDPACLAFYETARSVRTASYRQVRKPVYASSIGRWRAYRRHLGPLFAELEGLVSAED